MIQLNFRNMRSSGCNSPNLLQNPTGTWVTFLWPVAEKYWVINQQLCTGTGKSTLVSKICNVHDSTSLVVGLQIFDTRVDFTVPVQSRGIFSHLRQSFSWVSGRIHNAVFPLLSLPTSVKIASLEWTPCDVINQTMTRRHHLRKLAPFSNQKTFLKLF